MLRDIAQALITGKALRGDAIGRFERIVAERLSVRHAIAVSSGRFGMRLILENLGLEPGDEVIMPAYTQVELPAVIADAGFAPVLADVGDGDVNCGAEQIAAKITPRTRVVLLTHVTGEAAADTDAILRLADERGLIVVEDNAHGIGVQTPDGRFLGTLGRAAFLSLETRKVVNTFGGGVILTDDDALAAAIRQILAPLAPSFGKLAKRLLSVLAEQLSLVPLFAPIVVRLLHSEALNRHMIAVYRRVHRGNRDTRVAFSNLQALLGYRQLETLDAIIHSRRELGTAYLDGLADVPDAVLDRDRLDRLRELIAADAPVRHNVYSLIVFGDEPRRSLKGCSREASTSASARTPAKTCPRGTG